MAQSCTTVLAMERGELMALKRLQIQQRHLQKFGITSLQVRAQSAVSEMMPRC